MDRTLEQILAALFQAHATIDALRQRNAELEQETSDQKKTIASMVDKKER
jgi:cell division protein FtsB